MLHLLWEKLTTQNHQCWRQVAVPMQVDKTGKFEKNSNCNLEQSQTQLQKIEVLGLKIRSLRFHHDQRKIMHDTLEQKFIVLALTDTWVAENDSIEESNIDGYLTIESKPRLNCWRRPGGLVFYITVEVSYRPIKYASEIECSIIKVGLDKRTKCICVLYCKVNHFSRILRIYFILSTQSSMKRLCSGIPTKTHSSIILIIPDLQNLLTAFRFEVRKYSPTRITPTSKNCLDHVIMQKLILADTIKTTISDHYTVTADMVMKQIGQGNENQTPMLTIQNLDNLKNGRALNFLFFLSHDSVKLPELHQKKK